MGRLWIMIGSVITAVVLVISSMSVLNVLAHEQVTEQFTFSADGIETIAVDTHDGRVEVIAADTDVIDIEAQVSHGLWRTRHSAGVDGDLLAVRARCPKILTWCRVDYRITVPAHVAVDVRTRNGRVRVVGIESSVDARTSNGPIELTDIGGDVTVRTSNGPITGESLTSTTVRARTSNGPIHLALTEPPEFVDTRTSNGPIEVVVPDDSTTYRIDVATSWTGSTHTEIRTDPTSDRSIQARTSNGPIDIRYP